ncbi:unnamed protein product [Allacma fusca]|uniref:Uncharacterized protein n=1 Tax=Allacma fusca TaxID=39272 RepID=A0A8J2Q0T2_9HEXA|nr:unnamed protein product [Allacma fusca]
MWDLDRLVKIVAWIYIVANTIFTILLMLAVAALSKVFGNNETIGDSHSTGLTLVDTAGTILFIILIFQIFLCFIGIDMGVILLRRGMDVLLERDSNLLKGWIVQTMVFLILILVGAPIAAFFQYSVTQSRTC